MKNLNKMNDREIEMGVAGTGTSWHNEVFFKLIANVLKKNVSCSFYVFQKIFFMKKKLRLRWGKGFISRVTYLYTQKDKYFTGGWVFN